jgi:uncharacterized membrane-anchored protein
MWADVGANESAPSDFSHLAITVRKTLAGIARVHSTPKRKAKALPVHDLTVIRHASGRLDRVFRSQCP